MSDVATVMLVALAAGFGLGCSSEDTEAAGVNAACTRDKDCQQGLACTGGVCTPQDAGSKAGGDAKSGQQVGDAGDD